MFFDTPVSGASTVVALETGVRIDGRVALVGRSGAPDRSTSDDPHAEYGRVPRRSSPRCQASLVASTIDWTTSLCRARVRGRSEAALFGVDDSDSQRCYRVALTGTSDTALAPPGADRGSTRVSSH
jgi:hypothetical protein